MMVATVGWWMSMSVDKRAIAPFVLPPLTPQLKEAKRLEGNRVA
jgi:hypothetical protein